jgi:hypothetical protein
MNKILCPHCGRADIELYDYKPSRSREIGYVNKTKINKKMKSLYICKNIACNAGIFEGVHFDSLNNNKRVKAVKTLFSFDVYKYEVRYWDKKNLSYAHVTLYSPGWYTYTKVTVFGKELVLDFLSGNVRGKWIAESREDNITSEIKFCFNERGEVYNEEVEDIW